MVLVFELNPIMDSSFASVATAAAASPDGTLDNVRRRSYLRLTDVSRGSRRAA
jgi:hypothetical protein